jgi:hypothetical protein
MNLEGDFVLQTDCGVTTSIAIRMAFPRDYPESEPTAFDAAGRFPVSTDRHIIKDGQFCLWVPPCSPWDRDDPSRLPRFLDEVTVFLERQMTFEAIGVWPGGQYKHGTDGYEEFMLCRASRQRRPLFLIVPGDLGEDSPWP